MKTIKKVMIGCILLGTIMAFCGLVLHMITDNMWWVGFSIFGLVTISIPVFAGIVYSLTIELFCKDESEL
jgi:hypothetical protein